MLQLVLLTCQVSSGPSVGYSLYFMYIYNFVSTQYSRKMENVVNDSQLLTFSCASFILKCIILVVCSTVYHFWLFISLLMYIEEFCSPSFGSHITKSKVGFLKLIFFSRKCLCLTKQTPMLS